MDIGIFYVSFTGNTKYGLDYLKKCFLKKGYNCDLIPITKIISNINFNKYDICGFASPIFHGYPAENMLDFINNLPYFKDSLLSIIILNACFNFFDLGFWGSREEFKTILDKKNIEIIDYLSFYSEASHPIIRTIFLNKYLHKYISTILSSNRPNIIDFQKIENFSDKLEIKYQKYKKGQKPKLLLKPYKKYLSKYIYNLTKILNNTVLLKSLNKEKCIRCQICITNCPIKALYLGLDSYPKFDLELCLNCQNCINICPQNAINYKIIKKLNTYKRKEEIIKNER